VRRTSCSDFDSLSAVFAPAQQVITGRNYVTPGVKRMMSVHLFRLLSILLVAATPNVMAQNDSLAPNSDPTYQALRNVTLSDESVAVSNLALKREAGVLHLRSGTICFVIPVNGKVTGAVFSGDGSFVLEPQIVSEQNSLKLLTKESQFSESFDRMVLRFTDGTYEEIKKAGTAINGGCDAGALKDTQHTTRHKLKNNLEIRLLEDVLSPSPGLGLFVAFIHGKNYDGHELYRIDPQHEGTEQVQFMTYDARYGEWASLPMREYKPGTIGHPFRINRQQLDTTLEKNGNLIGHAKTEFIAQLDGLRVMAFDLFPSLRVRTVKTEDGQPLSFIQEDKNDDADFAVILPKALTAGEHFTIATEYEGKEAVTNEGYGNYFPVPVARMNWYPNNPGGSTGEYVTYDMTFRIPQGMQIAATGRRVSESNEGGQNVSVWKSEGPQTVAGFSFGSFKVEQSNLSKPEYLVESFANQGPPNWVDALRYRVRIGTVSTTRVNKEALEEGELAVKLYTSYFGPSLFKHLQLTQQTACDFGQSWPELVWIPICYYFDATVRHELGVVGGDRGYWKAVIPHEVAHQWWGHTVGFSSGRDEWMSEGFSEMSASLYLAIIENDPNKFITFWNDERELLLNRNDKGFRAIDVGPLTMGYRANNARTGIDITRRLIYPKGAYILHMIRMMMFDKRTGDDHFEETMQDFVKTYSGRAATTEDFKAMLEKHMTPEMDLEHTHKMDWFFNEYIYGTQLPSYGFKYSFDTSPEGDVILNYEVSQMNVDKAFSMLVPIYLELEEGKSMMLGRAALRGNTSDSGKVPLKGLKTKPRRALINYYDDVLASPN